jgi:hypothetical protein
MKRRLIIGIIVLSAGICFVHAEQSAKNSERVQIEVEFVSRYLWRGFNLGGPGFQAAVNGKLFENDFQALELEAWGYSDFRLSTKEIDLSLSYSFFNKNASIRIYDYWYVPEMGENYFNYKNDFTSHTLEAQFEYTFNLKKENSLTLLWATFFYGNDKKQTSTDSYKQAYSSYFEMKYEGNFISPKYGCEASIGFSPWESPMNYEVEKFSWVNAELKVNRTFNLSDNMALTPSVAFTVNPVHKEAYISFGLALSF